MAKIVEILKTERKRPTAADFNIVHMYKTGQFYTAYDWSAWIIHVRDVSQGVEFLGAFVKPYRDYISNKTLNRISQNLKTMDMHDAKHVEASINSYLGVLSHSSSFNIKRELFEEMDGDWLSAA